MAAHGALYGTSKWPTTRNAKDGDTVRAVLRGPRVGCDVRLLDGADRQSLVEFRILMGTDMVCVSSYSEQDIINIVTLAKKRTKS